MTHFDRRNFENAGIRRIVVTGGAGFIGCHLTEALSRRYTRAEIMVLDALTYAVQPMAIERLNRMSNVKLVRGDICDTDLAGSLLQGADLVFHLAAESHVTRSFSDPTLFERVNSEGTQAILQGSFDGGVGRFVHFSTDEVYGTCNFPVEEDQPFSPSSPYAQSKANAEKHVADFQGLGLDVVVLRPSNAVGIGQHKEKLIPNFVLRSLEDEAFALEGDGLQVRTFLPVGDLVAAAILVAEKGTRNTAYNVSGLETLSVIEVGRLVAKATGRYARFKMVTDRPVNDRAYMIDGSRLASLGYRQKGNLAKEVKAIIADLHKTKRKTMVTPSLVPASADLAPAAGKAIAFHVPHRAPGEAANLAAVLSSGKLSSGGPFTTAVEARLAAMTKSATVRLTHSCTGAMEAALLALGIGPGDEVIVPTFTFAATATAVTRTGAKPVLCDVDVSSLMAGDRHIKARLTDRTKAIMVVHYGGAVADMSAIVKLADSKGIPVIEDAAQALGATRDERHAGTFGTFGAISFHDTKVAGCGHGGALLCNLEDVKLHRRLEQILNRGTDFADKLAGRVPYYQWVSHGSHLRPGELEAAVMAAQLDDLPRNLAKRQEIAEVYASRLASASFPWRFVDGNTAAGSNFHIFGLLMDSPDIAARLLAEGKRANIQIETHYAPLNVSPFARQNGLSVSECPGGVSVWSKLVRLPLHTSMAACDATRVADFLVGFARKIELEQKTMQLAG